MGARQVQGGALGTEHGCRYLPASTSMCTRDLLSLYLKQHRNSSISSKHRAVHTLKRGVDLRHPLCARGASVRPAIPDFAVDSTVQCV